MKIGNYRDTESTEVKAGIFKREVITGEDGAPNFRMRVIEAQPGSSPPSGSHWYEHEMFVLSGEGVAISSEGETPIGKDSVIFVAPHEQHSFRATGNEPLRLICVVPLQA